MRHLILLLFFSLPCIVGASISAPISQGKAAIAQQTIPHGFASKKQRFFERFVEKISVNGLQKSNALPNGSNGKWLCISGFVIGALVIAALIPPISIALLFTFGAAPYLILSLTGLTLSILGLRKALGGDQTRRIRRYAIAGIVLNGLVALLGLILWIGLS